MARKGGLSRQRATELGPLLARNSALCADESRATAVDYTDVVTGTAQFTRADYERLPEGFPAELIDGMLVKEPSPTWDHQTFVGRLFTRLQDYAGAGRVVVSPIDVFIDDYNVLQPDVLVLDEEAAAGPRAKHVPIPLLVLEVLSPSTAGRDRVIKTGIYLGAGVKEVWLVDPEARTVEVVTDAGPLLVPEGEKAISQALKGFELSVHELFE